jgi:hypothetical protein
MLSARLRDLRCKHAALAVNDGENLKDGGCDGAHSFNEGATKGTGPRGLRSSNKLD